MGPGSARGEPGPVSLKGAELKSIILSVDTMEGRVDGYLHEDGEPETKFLEVRDLDPAGARQIRDAVRAAANVLGVTVTGRER